MWQTKKTQTVQINDKLHDSNKVKNFLLMIQQPMKNKVVFFYFLFEKLLMLFHTHTAQASVHCESDISFVYLLSLKLKSPILNSSILFMFLAKAILDS